MTEKETKVPNFERMREGLARPAPVDTETTDLMMNYLGLWRKAALKHEDAKASYKALFADAYIKSTAKSDAGRKIEADNEPNTRHAKHQMKLAEVDMNHAYFALQIAFIVSGKQFIGPEIR